MESRRYTLKWRYMAQNIKNKRSNSSHSQAQSLKAIVTDDLYDVSDLFCVHEYECMWVYDWVYDCVCVHMIVHMSEYMTHTLCVCACACMHDSAVVWLGVLGRSMTFWLPPLGRLPPSASVFSTLGGVTKSMWYVLLDSVHTVHSGVCHVGGRFQVNVHYSQQKSVPCCLMIAGHAQQGS